MSDKKDKHFSTRQVRDWYMPDPGTEPILPPIHQSTSYTYPSLDAFLDAGSRMAFGREAFYHSRLGNPTVAALEKKLEEMERAELCVAVSSGMAAINMALLSQLRAGDMVLAHSRLYSATDTLFHDYLPRLGFPVEQVDLADPKNAEKVLAAVKAGIVYIETPSSLLAEVLDIQALAQIAHKAGALLIVDSSWGSPYSLRPLALGADLVVGSMSNYLSGHDDAMGGYLAGSADLVSQAQNHAMIMGPCLSPLNAWLLIRGLRTLSLRLDRIQASATEIAKFLENHPLIQSVHYPGLKSHPSRKLATRQMENMGGMMAFYIKGGLEAAMLLLDSLSLIRVSIGLGDCSTLIEHPATMTHMTMGSERRSNLGVADNLIRLSVGLEQPGDLIADLSAALENAGEEL